MRFVFMDEAGTSGSREETYRAVVAIIIDADKQLLAAEMLLNEALHAVPPKFRNGFIFHAEEIMNNDKYRDGWRLTDRVNFLRFVMNIPQNIGLPVAFSMVRSSAKPTPMMNILDIKQNEEQHVIAFMNCVAHSDKWIRENAAYNEIGMIVAEYHYLKEILSSQVKGLRQSPFVVKGSEGFAWTQKEREQGYCEQDGILRVSRIRETVHFVQKDEDRLVWIADAVAYGIKRFFSQLQWGDQFGKAVGVSDLNFEDFTSGVCSSGILDWHT